MGKLRKFEWTFTFMLFTFQLCASQCPDHKSFDSNAGCVSECPEPFYIRNNTCVFDCGNDFVDETRHCVPSCPGGIFFRETLHTSGKGMFIEKICTVACNYDEVIFNNECLKRCPPSIINLDFEDLVNRDRCVFKCPAEKQYLLNITFNNIDYSKCASKCEAFILDGYCVPKCPTKMVHLNKTCMKNCTDSHNTVLDGECFQECNEHSVQSTCRCPENRPYIENRTCVFNGSDQSQELHNETCVTEIPNADQKEYIYINKTKCVEWCPDDKPFICDSGIGLTSDCVNNSNNRGNKICLTKCPANRIVYNNVCISYCPKYLYEDYSFQKQCFDTCPKGTLHSNGQICHTYYPQTRYEYTSCQSQYCVNTCPDNTYNNGTYCVEYCSDGQFLKNNACLSNCSEHEYIQNIEYNTERKGNECVQECKTDLVLYKGVCVDYCPEELPLLLNRTCVKECPPEKDILAMRRTLINCLRKFCYVDYFFEYSMCTDICAESEYIYNGSCVNVCPDRLFALNGTCLSVCPQYAPLIQPMAVTLQRIKQIYDDLYMVVVYTETMFECVDSCSYPYGIHDFETKTCVMECPDNRPFVLEVDNTLKCVQQCPSNELLKVHNKTEIRLGEENKTIEIVYCSSYCPEDTYYFNETCLLSCPAEANHIFNGKCVICTKFTLIEGQKVYCVDECPSKFKFINDKVCVDKCPEDKGNVINGHFRVKTLSAQVTNWQLKRDAIWVYPRMKDYIYIYN